MGEAPFTGVRAPGSVNFATLQAAARVLRVAGFSAEAVAEALEEVYGVRVPVEEVERLLSALSPELERKPVLASFLAALTKEKLPLLMYCAGAAVGDGDNEGKLRVKDGDFAGACAEALRILTDRDVEVRQRSDGRYCVKSPLLAFVKRGLWKVLAYLDRLSGHKAFLGGLLDAEAAISPHLDGRWKSLTLQITFGNTDPEVAEFVYSSLKDLGLNPRMRTIQPPHSQAIREQGKLTTARKKPLYVVYAKVPLSEAEALKRIELHCRRKRQLIEFFLAVKDLPAQLRYELFLRCWRKEGKRWELVCSEPLEYVKSELVNRQPPRRRRKKCVARTYAVECLACGREGIFTLRRVATEGGTLIQICVTHRRGECVLEVVEMVEGKEGPTLPVKCKGCGKQGRLFVFPDRRDKCLRVVVRHYINREARKMCPLIRLPLLRERLSQADTPPRARRTKPVPNPTPALQAKTQEHK